MTEHTEENILQKDTARQGKRNSTDEVFGTQKEKERKAQEEAERRKKEEEAREKKEEAERTRAQKEKEEKERIKREEEARKQEAEEKRRKKRKKQLAIIGCVTAAIALLVTAFFTVHFWTDATCTTNAVCRLCGKERPGLAGHTWKNATCTEPKTCTVCAATEGTAAGHRWTPGSCTTPGTCAVCGISDGTFAEHQWAVATCTDPRICTLCGATDGSAAGHQWTAASCTEPKTCAVCGTTDGSPAGHSWMAATCTAAETCSVCGAVNGSALGHTWTSATYSAPKTCTRCGATEGSKLEAPATQVAVGDIIRFGTYEQDGNTANGAEEIEWIVLDKSGDYVLLLSRYGLDQQPYHTSSKAVTWEECSLRKWLNTEFLKSAFSADEQKRLGVAENPADANPDYDTDPGENTMDQVFVLSIQEAVYYYPNYQDRACVATAYAQQQGAFARPGTNTCWWWLRTPGESEDKASSVNSNGSYDSEGSDVAGTKGAVRPSVWVKIG